MNAIPGRWWLTAVVVIITAILLSPFYWVLIGSFMTPAELFGVNQSFWPRNFVVENWSKALERLWPHVRNSLLVSTATSIGTLLITAPAAYGLVWKKPIGRNALSSFMLVTQMLPGIVFVIPLFIVFSKINLVNTMFGLILADMTFTVPFALIMLSAYMKELPYELVEAALVDGAGPLPRLPFRRSAHHASRPGHRWDLQLLDALGRPSFRLEPDYREQFAASHAGALQSLRPIRNRLGFPASGKCPHRDSGFDLRNLGQPFHCRRCHPRRGQVSCQPQ